MWALKYRQYLCQPIVRACIKVLSKHTCKYRVCLLFLNWVFNLLLSLSLPLTVYLFTFFVLFLYCYPGDPDVLFIASAYETLHTHLRIWDSSSQNTPQLTIKYIHYRIILTYLFIHTHIHSYIPTYIWSYTHTYIHTHIHIYKHILISIKL